MKLILLFGLLVGISGLFIYRYKSQYKEIVKFYILLLITVTIVDVITFGNHLLGALLYDYSIVLIGIIMIIKIKKYISNNIGFLLLLVFIYLLLFLPLIYALYYLIFSNPLTTSDMFAIYQTNINESLEFVSQFVPFYSFIPIILVVFYIYKISKKYINLNIEKKVDLYLIGKLVVSVLIIAYLFTSTRTTSLYTMPFFSYKEYITQLKLFEKTQSQVNIKDFKVTKKEKNELTIIVIGESLNRYHMSLYGYDRKTTPNLDKLKDDLVIYDNTYSNDVETMGVLSYALTQTNQLNDIKYFDALSLINIYKKAGFKTVWLTNQQLYGKWDNLVSIIANQADRLIALNNNMGELTFDTKYYDEKLLGYLDKELQEKGDKNKVIFIHMMGSHAAYKLRYPKKFEKYPVTLIDTIKDKLHINKTQIHIINAYDNSVYYNDYVVSSIIKRLQNINKPISMVYFSDHSEDLTHYKGHGRTNFTYEMTQIPMIFWFSEQYKIKYINKYKNIVSNKHKLYCNDMIYDTTIGISNIETNESNKGFDLSSKAFNFKDKDAYTMHKKKKYNVKENKFYKAKNNE